jgi:hypothetical protein
MLNVDFDTVSLIVLFVNYTEDLHDFAYFISKTDAHKLVGTGNDIIYNKLMLFNDVHLFNLITPKEELIKFISSYIDTYKK